MKKEKLHIHYDAKGDFLEVRFGQPKPSYYEHIGDDTFERRDRKTNKAFGYAFYNVKKREERQPCDIEVPVPNIAV